MPQVYEAPKYMYDVSLVPWLRCDNACSFCMYRCSPANKAVLSLEIAEAWLKSINWKDISSTGLYGGELLIDIPKLEPYVELLRKHHKPMFIISNGSFTTSKERRAQFSEFLHKYPMRVVISGTDEHRAHQDIDMVNMLRGYPDIFTVKDGEELHPMGRMELHPIHCKFKCTSDIPTRLALFPGGHICFQVCDGAYPMVGDWRSRWSLLKERVESIRTNPGSCREYVNINSITKELEGAI